MRLRSIITIIIASLFLLPICSNGQAAKTIVKQIIKKEVKQAKKIGTKKVVKSIEKKCG